MTTESRAHHRLTVLTGAGVPGQRAARAHRQVARTVADLDATAHQIRGLGYARQILVDAHGVPEGMRTQALTAVDVALGLGEGETTAHPVPLDRDGWCAAQDEPSPAEGGDEELPPPPSTLCLTPVECAGKRSCPRRYACTE